MTRPDGRRPPLGVRLFGAVAKEPDWHAMSAQDLAGLAASVNRKRSSPLARLITGWPDWHASITWQQFGLSDRRLRARVHRPRAATTSVLPVVVHVHGGGFVGTAVQSDWVNSHLAARLPAVVVSVEHRLLAPGTTIADVMDDTWDALDHVLANASSWGIDPSRAAVFGESTGGLTAALTAIRARDAGIQLRAQVLSNPCVDLSDTRYDGASVARYADGPGLTRAQMDFFVELALADSGLVSPLQVGDLARLAPALVIIPTHDPLADQGRAYAARLGEHGTSVQAQEYPGATHAFLSMPGLAPQARTARAEILAFLLRQLSP